MRYLVNYATLVWYDGPQVIFASDTMGEYWIGVNGGGKNHDFVMAMVQVTRDDIDLYMAGNTTIRALYINGATFGWIDLITDQVIAEAKRPKIMEAVGLDDDNENTLDIDNSYAPIEPYYLTSVHLLYKMNPD